MSQAAPSAFKIAFVCTGNRFRSPLASAVLRRAVGDLAVRVDSLGTLDVQGLPPLPHAAAAARRLGIDLGAHRTRPLRRGELAEDDLVVGFEHMHVATSVIDGGAHRDRVFTLPELVQLLESLQEPESDDCLRRARRVLGAAVSLRGNDRAAAPQVEDPLGRSADAQERIAEQVVALTTRLARGLFGTS